MIGPVQLPDGGRATRSVAALFVFGLVAAGLLVSATRSVGLPGTASTTNDGGAWLLNRDRSAIGHVNRQVEEITAALRVAEPGEDYEVDQAGDILLVHNRSLDRAEVFDQRTHQSRGTLDVPPGIVLHATDSGAVAVRGRPFAVWSITEEQLLDAESLGRLDPVHRGAGQGLATLGHDGRLLWYDADTTVLTTGSSSVRQFRTEEDRIGPQVEEPTGLTSVGATTVLWHESSAVLVTNGEVLELPLEPPAAAFQQPGPQADHIRYLATDGRVVEISTADGSTSVVHDLTTEDHLAPIFHDGCLFTVAMSPPTFARLCDTSHDERPLLGAGPELRLRLVNGWVWVNDVESGRSWSASATTALGRVDDWGEALADAEGTDEEPADGLGSEPTDTQVAPDNAQAVLERADELRIGSENRPPVSEDDFERTRVDRPTLIEVLRNDQDPDGDALVIESVELEEGSAALVSLTTDRLAVQISPAAGFTGSLSFTYVISDGRGGFDSADGLLEVVSASPDLNSPPTVNTDVAVGRAGEPVSLNVLENDDDPEGDTFTLTNIEADTGTVVFAPDGQVTFTPDRTEQAATIDLEYTTTDEFGASAEGTLSVRLRLADTNSAPDARNDIIVTTVGTPAMSNLLANDDDPDNDPLAAARQPRIVHAPTATETIDLEERGSGPASLTSEGEFTFTPASAGTYVFDYLISDGQTTDIALVRIEVDEANTNEHPIAVRDDTTITRGTTRLVSVLDNDGDPDGDVISIVDWTRTRGLEVAELPGTGFWVTARTDAPNAALFRYSISDGMSPPVSTSVVIAIAEPTEKNLPPIVLDDAIDARPGRTLTVPVLDNDVDPEGEALTVVSAGLGDDGQDGSARATSDGRAVVISIDDAARRDLTVLYEAADPAGSVAVGRIRVHVLDSAAPNRPPVARLDIARTIEGKPTEFSVVVNDSDPDGDPIRVESISEQPSGGRAELTDDGSVRYTPATGSVGTDHFSYVVIDTEGGRTIGNVRVGVMPRPLANRPPSALDDHITSVIGGGTVSLDPTANDLDPDFDSLQITSATDPAQGTIELAGGELLFTPPPDPPLSSGTPDGSQHELTISYRISDGRGGFDEALISIMLTPRREPQPPIAMNDSIGPLRGGQQIVVDVLANDSDPDGERAAMTLSTESAGAAVVDGQLEIEMPTESEQITYTVTDGDGLSDQAVLTVFVVANAAPEAENLSAETEFGQPVRLAIGPSVSDADGDPLFFACCDVPRGGLVEVAQSSVGVLDVIFSPDEDFVGDGSFSFSVDDQAGHLVSASVTVTVLPPDNRPPLATSASVEIEAGELVPFDLATLVDDPDPGERLLYSVSDSRLVATHDGSIVTLAASNELAGQTGDVQFTVADSNGATDSASLTVTVLDVAAPPPSAVADTAETTQGQAVEIPVLVNDIDPLGRGLQITRIAPSSSGATDPGGTTGSVLFTPDPDHFGTATFSYTAADGAGRESVGLVTVEVAGRPDVPASPSVEANDGRALVTWTTPTSNGSPVDGYEVELASASGAGSVVAVSVGNRHQFSGLSNGVDHQFRVRAHNRAGWSSWGVWSQPARPDTRPERPSAPRVDFGNGELLVTWDPPTNRGSEITGYKLEIGGGANAVATIGPATSYDWQGLRNGVEYQFRLVAVNAAGDSSWSPWSVSEHPLGAPRASAAPTPARGNRYIDIDWSAPDDNGDPISGYEIELRRTGSTISVAGAETTHRWADLDNGVAQQFRVRARNRAAAAGPWSAWSAALAPCSVPDPIVTPSAQRGDQRATVSWTVPDDQGCTLTGFEIRANGTTTRSVAPSVTSLVFDGLSNGLSYSFEVRALNAEGESTWSSATPPVTPAGPPGTPSNASATAESVGAVTIAWTSGTDNGSPVLTHELSINGGAATVVSGTAHVATGLADNTTYSFRIRACNSVGCSGWSTPTSAETWGPPSVPQAVTILAGNGEVTLSWSAPADSGDNPLVEYVYLLNGQSTGNWPASANSFLWRPLPNGVSVTGAVRACNAVGCSAFVEASGTPTAPPAAVTISVGGTYRGAGCQAVCNQVAVMGANFSPNTTVNTVCHSTYAGEFSSSNATSVDANGAIDATPCFFGYPGETVWVVVNGVTSNSIIWP